MKVSVMLGSCRPGGVDISFYGLARQQTRVSWELIFVDGRYHTRHAQVLDAWERACAETGCTVPLIHVPNHRFQPYPWRTICAGFNTGFMLAEGELVIMLLDYAYTPPGWLQAHVDAHAPAPRVVMAPHAYCELPPVHTKDGKPPMNLPRDAHPGVTPEAIIAERERYDEISIFERSFTPDMLTAPLPWPHCDPKMIMPDGPVTELPFHTKNESFPVANLLTCNGMDEHYDRMTGPGDPELAHRLAASGLQGWICGAGIVHVPNVRWALANPNASGFYDKPTPGHEWRGSYVDGNAYYDQSRAERRVRARNPFEITERKKEIWHWRELSQKRESILPYNEVSDADYWRGKL